MSIDADAHVIECSETWSYFPQEKLDFRPAIVPLDQDQLPPYLAKRPSNGVLIDGQIFRQLVGSDDTTWTTSDTRELRDTAGRLRHMDEREVDVQVLYPTMLLTEITMRPEVDAAICESYNRWLADRCADSGGRLRWVAVLPYLSIPDALVELRRAKRDGAAAVFKRGVECGHRRASDPYFFPIYQLAQELDLPICVHTSHPYTGNHNKLTKTQPSMFTTAFVMDAFMSLVSDGVPEKFPDLRFGFVEAGAGWVQYALWVSSFGATIGSQEYDQRLWDQFASLLESSRLFVTCEPTEDIRGLIEHLGDSSLCVGSDYGHADRATIIFAHRELLKRADITKQSALKLADSNARVLYGLES